MVALAHTQFSFAFSKKNAGVALGDQIARP